MLRRPEQDLMEEPQQVLAYANADFADVHNQAVDLFHQLFATRSIAPMLDLGCGPGDVCRRMARRFPDLGIVAVDGSKAMLQQARQLSKEYSNRIRFVRSFLPDRESSIPRQKYGSIISTSLLHHLAQPMDLWQTIVQHGHRQTCVFVVDLKRPSSEQQAAQIVQDSSADEPEVLRRDFYSSLLAAYEPQEIRAQLVACGLEHLSVDIISERHLCVHGVFEQP